MFDKLHSGPLFLGTFLDGILLGFPGGSVVKNLPAMQETQKTQVQSLGWEDPLEEEMATKVSGC